MPEAAGLGAMLRECREAKGVSLEDLSRDTRIAARLLLALEEDRFNDLPAPIFVRGFIRAYCAAVGEPPERALTRYDTASGAIRGPSAVPRTAALVQAPARRSRVAFRRLAPKLGVAGALVLVGGAVYLFATAAASRPGDAPRVRDESSTTPAPNAPREPVAVQAPAASDVTAPRPASMPASPAAPVPAPIAAPIAAVPKPAPAPARPRVPAMVTADLRGHVLVARAREATWVWVSTEDGAPSQELLEAGTVREWQSAGRFTVTVGNAGGLTLELDGVALPPLGRRGQVVRDVRLPREPTP